MKNIKKEIQEELKNLAPSLSKMEKKEGFQIPENYFNELPDQIMSQLDFSKTSLKKERVSWIEILSEKITVFFQPRIAIGFSMAMLMICSIYFLTKNTTTTSSAFAELSIAEMENYIEENIEDFDEEILFEFVAENEMNSLGKLEVEDEDLDEYMFEIIEDLEDEDLEDLL